MGRITVDNILEATKQGELFDIVNAIRNSGSSFYKEFVPLANATNVAEVGRAITMHDQTQNEFINSLVNRIGLVIVRHVVLKNPLSRFKSGTQEMGNSIEEIFTDLTAAHLYDPWRSETEVFKREIPNVKTLYHEMNRKEFYKQTIQENSLKQAFLSWDKFGSFVSSVIQALYNSAEVDEYKYMKLLLTNYYAKGHFKTVGISSNFSPGDLVEKAREYAMLLTMPQGSRKYNSLAVHTTTSMEDLYVLMTPSLAARIDVNVLANAFNMDKASFLGNRIILDSLGHNPETNEKIEMILIDRKFFMVFDNELKMTTQYNPQGLYWNYWLHVWQTISSSRFANAVAFVSGRVDPVDEIVLSPSITEIRGATPTEFYTNVRENDDVSEYYTMTNPVFTFRALTEDGSTPITTGITLSAVAGDISKVKVQINPSLIQVEKFILEATLIYEDGHTMDGQDPLKYTKKSRAFIQVYQLQ